MAIGEAIETHLGKHCLVTAQTIAVDDPGCLCRLQALVGELLVKNELLRHQLRRNDHIFARLHQLIEKEQALANNGNDVISPLLQACALLACQRSIPPR